MLASSMHRAIEPPSRQSIEPASSLHQACIEPASSLHRACIEPQHRASIELSASIIEAGAQGGVVVRIYDGQGGLRAVGDQRSIVHRHLLSGYGGSYGRVVAVSQRPETVVSRLSALRRFARAGRRWDNRELLCASGPHCKACFWTGCMDGVLCDRIQQK